LGRGRSARVTIRKLAQKGKVSEKKSINLADGKDIVDVQALEERPHGEIDIDQATSKVESAREAGNDLETRVARLVLAAGIKLDQVACAGCRVGEDLGDLERVGLYVFGEARPRQSEIVTHEIIHGVARNERYRGFRYR
jgi:hypothetical protein